MCSKSDILLYCSLSLKCEHCYYFLIVKDFILKPKNTFRTLVLNTFSQNFGCYEYYYCQKEKKSAFSPFNGIVWGKKQFWFLAISIFLTENLFACPILYFGIELLLLSGFVVQVQYLIALIMPWEFYCLKYYFFPVNCFSAFILDRASFWSVAHADYQLQNPLEFTNRKSDGFSVSYAANW